MQIFCNQSEDQQPSFKERLSGLLQQGETHFMQGIMNSLMTMTEHADT